LNTTAAPDKILEAMRAGAAEYLYPPFKDQVRAAIERVGSERRATTQTRAPRGKTVGFLSAKGGCGSTTLACHVAVELPAQTQGKVLLADFDFEAGLIGFLFKSKSPYTILDAVQNTQRLDSNYWTAIVSNGITGLEIVTAPTGLTKERFAPEQLKYVLNFIRGEYDWIVVDLGRSITSFSAGAIEQIDQLFLVTTLEVPALHQAQQMVQSLLNSGFRKDKLALILNRAPKRYDVTVQELESMLGAPIYMTLPSDYPALNESYTEGKLLPPGTVLGKQFSRLAMKIAGTEDQRTKRKYSLF